jgi:hypothetical protein
MSLIRCPSCAHANPAESKFCSACGGTLHLPSYLASCPHCGVVGPIKATVCYWCSGALPGRRSRWPSRVIVGTAILAAIAALGLGYYTYRQRSLVDAPQAPAASSKTIDRGASAGAGVIGPDATAGDTKPAEADARLPRPAISPSVTPPAASASAMENQARAGRQPVESKEAKATAATIARPQAISAGRAGERGPSPQDACTEAAAALGLCTAKPVLKKQATDARKSGGQEPPFAQPCTEAVAALGLCAPATTQKRE